MDPKDEEAVHRAVDDVLGSPAEVRSRRPELWDGRAAGRIVSEVAGWLRRASAGTA